VILVLICFDLVLATCAASACFGCLTSQPEALSSAQPCPLRHASAAPKAPGIGRQRLAQHCTICGPLSAAFRSLQEAEGPQLVTGT